ncbi:MAG: hypothetical protein LBF16_08280 [Pseudomonadales bacterium]|jgi:hypothetical protein|nr:hypothetical protein [Pseudomonadales bacterium]
MKKMLQIGAMGVMLSVAAVAAQAHHSFSAEYDAQQGVVLSGIVTKISWQNPHVYIYADVTNDKGEVTPWAFEMGAPAVLTRTLGWTRSTLNVGDLINVDGHIARDGSNLANARTITLANGQKLGAGSSENVTP